ncbi:haloacid dehalogenase type II [Roseovarius nitratireducens]|uniref:haloacid dehalogenase type II n=1 Tax=Roseovarius nitratireducens TaxID=2044597 RepID=UPI000CE16D10|nr:haloacid dehalogenase type II [Roseovarius nitratireducens]
MPELKSASIIVFDVNETLIDITTLEPFFERLFGDSGVMREWFPELILYSQTLTLSGLYTPFGNLAGGILRMVGANRGVAVKDDDIAELKTLFGQMPAYGDVKPALSKLRDAGFTLVTLTNSARSPSPTPLENAGVDAFFDHHFSVGEVGKFKPHPATYEMVASRMNVSMAEMCMVACHLWDTIGAQAVGCQGAFIARPHNSALNVPQVPTPDFIAGNLAELADQIIGANRPPL